MLNIDNSLIAFIVGFIITIIIEVIVAYIMKFRSKNQIKTVALASVITYPILHIIITISYFVSTPFSNTSLYIIFLEILVVLSEFYILNYVFKNKYSKNHLLLIAFTMNAVSYGIGLILF